MLREANGTAIRRQQDLRDGRNTVDDRVELRLCRGAGGVEGDQLAPQGVGVSGVPFDRHLVLAAEGVVTGSRHEVESVDDRRVVRGAALDRDAGRPLRRARGPDLETIG